MKKLLIAVLAGACGVANAQWFTNLNATSVPDNDPAGVDIIIPVSGLDTVLADINFGTIVDHTWQGDLVFRLTAPDGITSATLMSRSGTEAGAVFGFEAAHFGGTDIFDPSHRFILDDQAASVYNSPGGTPAGTVAQPGIDAVTGVWKPYTDMNSVFGGINPNGLWTVNYSDHEFGESGMVRMTGIEISAVPEPASMIALGLGAAALLRRRRSKKA